MDVSRNVSKDHNPRAVTFTQGCCSFNLTPPSTPSSIYDEESIVRQIAKLYVGPQKEQTPVEETISISKSGQGLFCFPPALSKSDSKSFTPSPVVTTTTHKYASEMFGCTWGALPSRWLYVSNFPTDIYGDVQEILAGIGYAYVIYYDLRDAVKAHQFLRHQNAPHNQRRLEIQFSSKPCAVQSWDAVAEDFKRHQKTGLAIPPPPRQFPVAPSPDLENRSEDMAKFSPSPPENSTVISSGNRSIPEKNTLDLERIQN
ncbi:1411_t:CDS:2, partial [Racocetra fulgida]